MKTAHIRFTVDMTGASGESQPIRVNELFGYSIVSKWGASAGRTGSLKLQASNDAYYKTYKNNSSFQDMQEEWDNNPNPNATWEDIPGSAKTVDATADQHVWNVDGAYYSAVRVVWVGTAGAASPDDVEAFFHGKGTID